VAQPLSKTSLVIRVLLILILLVMIGAFVLERRAASAAQSAFDQAKQVVADKKPASELQQVVGRKADAEETRGQVRELRFVYKGVIREYTVRVLFNVLDKGEAGEEAHLDVYDKLKGQGTETMETAAELPSIQKKK